MNRKLLVSISIFLITFLLIFPPSAIAQDNLPDSFNSEVLNEALYDFCQKRQGDTMNLETWYAGKCGANNTFTDEGTGFGDIIILHALEFLIGEQRKSTSEIIQKLQEIIQENQTSQSQPQTLLSTVESLNTAFQGSYSQEGLLVGTSKLLSLPFSTPPAQSHQYIASIRENMARHKIVQPTYAQEAGGFGFTHLQGFLPIWRATRNIAYLIFVLLFLVYGFMIMFRIKINPQTSVNIQQALPKLIVTLLLITFSYAIIGFMFDLIWVIYFVILGALETFGIIGGTGNILLSMASGRAGLIASWFINSIAAIIGGIPGAFSAILSLPGALGYVALAGLTFATWGGTGILIAVIFLIATIYSFGKLLFKLIGAYISVIVNLIFAPLILLGNIFPGSKSISNWLRNTFANLIVFPATSFLLLFSYLFMIQPLPDFLSPQSTISQGLVNSEVIARVPVLFPWAGTGAKSMMALVGLGLLFMTPKYVDMIRDAFQVEPFKYGADLSFLTQSAIGRQVIGGATSTLARRGLSKIPFKGKWGQKIATDLDKSLEQERPPKTTG